MLTPLAARCASAAPPAGRDRRRRGWKGQRASKQMRQRSPSRKHPAPTSSIQPAPLRLCPHQRHIPQPTPPRIAPWHPPCCQPAPTRLTQHSHLPLHLLPCQGSSKAQGNHPATHLVDKAVLLRLCRVKVLVAAEVACHLSTSRRGWEVWVGVFLMSRKTEGRQRGETGQLCEATCCRHRHVKLRRWPCTSQGAKAACARMLSMYSPPHPPNQGNYETAPYRNWEASPSQRAAPWPAPGCCPCSRGYAAAPWPPG